MSKTKNDEIYEVPCTGCGSIWQIEGLVDIDILATLVECPLCVNSTRTPRG